MNNGSSEKGNILREVESLLQKRKADDVPGSYTAMLMRNGEGAIKRKIGEEALEVVLCEPGNHEALRAEITDLWFHCLVLMVYNGLALEEIFDEFSQRLNVGGLQEKAQRHSGK